ncbi:hypothetical protein DERF_007231 [Dermatophagoides farinae]|uniref:Peptidase S1 domain-containing protein n=1 Tax=Dermatophagoides farinae TaxID=6954 RepID=A0A922I1S8_DERFA|nr:hypothetical protein DERF_007231 [Dermatophagoides farinae]
MPPFLFISSSTAGRLSLWWLLILATTMVGAYELYKSKFNKLRHITLRDDAFCEAYQEFKDNNCISKLTFCSPLTDEQTLKMRQILCGPRFNVETIHHPIFSMYIPAQPNSFPWLAAIYNNDRRFICSGALVAPKTVITSAQCVTDANGGNGGTEGGGEDGGEGQRQQQPSGNFIVRFGRHNLNVSSVYDKAYEYDVETIEVSQQFDRQTLDNDFAILKLSSPVCNFAPISLPKRDDWENGYYFGSRAPVLYAGWGLGHYQKPYLRSLSSHLIPKDSCSKKFNWSPDQLSSSHLCVNPPINVCVGGIGTPLVSYAGHHCVLLGILSMGDHCNTAKLPLVFTKVSSFIDEIEKFIIDDFRSMNETSPLDDCLRYKHYHSRHPYFLYPPHPYSYDTKYDDNEYPKSHTRY